MEREENNLKLSTREKILICLVVWTGGIYLYHHFIYAPLHNEVVKRQKQNEILKHELTEAREIDADKNSIDTRKKGCEIEYGLLVRQIPVYPYIPEIIAFIEDIAGQSMAHLLSIDYQPAGNENISQGKSSSETTQSLDFAVSASGNYYELVAFLELLEQASRIYNVTAIKLEMQEKKMEQVTLLPLQTETNQSAELSPTQAATDETAEPSPQLKGWDRFDSDNIIMNVKLQAYCYGKTIPGAVDIDKTIDPVGGGRDNPFNF